MTEPKVSFQTLFLVIPSASEESSVDAALSATGTLTSPQPSPSQKERDIFAIPSASEESTHGCFTTLSMTEPKVSFQTPSEESTQQRHTEHTN
jgi:hypothetical protein